MDIDIVLPWVDETDIKWLTQKNYWQEKYGMDVEQSGEARYRDYGTLRYVFRSIEKYCPWVRKIFFITANGQRPSWLRESNKLQVVDHSEFIEKKYLPTFNSSVIMTNLYKIPGLSAKFIVMNDDFFFNKPLKESDFFRDELPVYSSEFDPIHPLGNLGNSFSHIVLNDLEMVAKYTTKKEMIKQNRSKYYTLKIGHKGLIKNLLLLPYKDLLGFKNFHIPAPYLKSSFGELISLETQAFDNMYSNKFRQSNDLNEWVFQYWELTRGNFIPMNAEKKGKYYQVTQMKQIFNDFDSRKHAMLCINDVSSLNNDEFKKLLHELSLKLQQKFPKRSIYEG